MQFRRLLQSRASRKTHRRTRSSPSDKIRTSYKIRPYTSDSKCLHARKRRHTLWTGDLAAHRSDRLMLLGSPPDMVHGVRLRKTHPSTREIRRADHTESALIKGIHPCFSGLQVQGTANSPAGMALSYSSSSGHRIREKYRA